MLSLPLNQNFHCELLGLVANAYHWIHRDSTVYDFSTRCKHILSLESLEVTYCKYRTVLSHTSICLSTHRAILQATRRVGGERNYSIAARTCSSGIVANVVA